MQVEACTEFLFSRDGITSERLATGMVVDIPDHMAKGLIFEGYVRPVGDSKAIGAAEENKALFVAPENKADGRRRKARMPQNEDEGGLD